MPRMRLLFHSPAAQLSAFDRNNFREMPEESVTSFEDVRHRIGDELVMLTDAWAQYTYLFASPERVDMLNTCARWYFATSQRLFLREVILGISRLTDPPTQGRHANLVLATLADDPALDDRLAIRTALMAMVSGAVSAAAPIRVHRSKYIAHLDHAVALDQANNPLPGIERAYVDDVLAKMTAAYRFYGSEVKATDFSATLHALGGADALVQALESSDRWLRIRAIRADHAARSPDAPAV